MTAAPPDFKSKAADEAHLLSRAEHNLCFERSARLPLSEADTCAFKFCGSPLPHSRQSGTRKRKLRTASVGIRFQRTLPLAHSIFIKFNIQIFSSAAAINSVSEMRFVYAVIEEYAGVGIEN